MNQEYYALVQEIHQEKLDLADKSKVMHAAESLVLMAFTGHLRGGYLAYNCGSWLIDQSNWQLSSIYECRII